MEFARTGEALYLRRERILREMAELVSMCFETEKNLANQDGATASTKCELEESRIWAQDRLHAVWSELEWLDKENKEQEELWEKS